MVSNNVELRQELGTNFIEYAMSVNTDRSLPDAKTGLKPVHRRILFDCLHKGILSTRGYVKCASVVGDTMGLLHPHGDSSIYGALVRLSQPWIMRYPLIDFYGNNGNIAGDPAAHYRYSECRLASLAEEGLLSGLKKDIVDFMPNYSETLDEPVTLPSFFPNLLVNPNTGIGVAMACNWLPHNLREVYNATLDYLDDKEPMLIGPDFSTGGCVINGKEIPKIMRSGTGSIKLRGRYKIEKNSIVFYEIPYGVNTETLMSQIGKLAEEDKLDGVTDVRDESNRKKGLRLVLQLNRNASSERIVNTLFRETDLQVSLSYNQTALVDKEPKLLNLKECIEIFINHGIDCIKRESTFDLKKAKERQEILEGLMKALEDIDNVISIIKNSKSGEEAKTNLAKKYNFTELQVKAITDMRLIRLANLEQIEIQEELKGLNSKIEFLSSLALDSDKARDEFMKRFKSLVDKYGDDRRTEITHLEETREEETIEDFFVYIQNGEVKKTPNKPASIKNAIKTDSSKILYIFCANGKVYRETPKKKATIEDKPLLVIPEDYNEQYIFFATQKGYIKSTKAEEYTSLRMKSVALKLDEDDKVIAVIGLTNSRLQAKTNKNKTYDVSIALNPPSGRNTKGKKVGKLDLNENIISLTFN